MTEFALGIDIGGTFTDVVALDLRSGRYETAKVLTTPENPQIGATDGAVSYTHLTLPTSDQV